MWQHTLLPLSVTPNIRIIGTFPCDCPGMPATVTPAQQQKSEKINWDTRGFLNTKQAKIIRDYLNNDLNQSAGGPKCLLKGSVQEQEVSSIEGWDLWRTSRLKEQRGWTDINREYFISMTYKPNYSTKLMKQAFLSNRILIRWVFFLE